VLFFIVSTLSFWLWILNAIFRCGKVYYSIIINNFV
jgi:hypothetical protein